MNPSSDWLTPDWPAPASVRACVTTRAGGVSLAPFDSLNLGDHVEDAPLAVAANRQVLVDALGCRPAWLQQVHSADVVEADSRCVPTADASWTATPGTACAVLTADCLPALFCDRAGTRVAAAHAGWRGLAAGVLEASVASMQCETENILAWLGPAIGPQAFEVGDEVRDVFLRDMPEAELAFVQGRPGKWMADIYLLARLRLVRAGVAAVHGGGFCTFSDRERFYSYRRDGTTGRMASLIWKVS